MDLIQESFQRLFPDKTLDQQTILKYNKKLGDFNGNIRLYQGILKVSLNYKWKEIDSEIRIGLIQSLLLKMFSKKYGKASSTNLEFYNNFVKNIHFMTPKTKTDSILETSFHRVNQNYFHDLLEKPNLSWSSPSFRKLACYNLHNDSVTVSSIFKESPEEVLDYLIYHELLHKKQKFQSKNNRNYFHTRKFREAENQYPNKEKIEEDIKKIIKCYRRGQRRNSFLSGLFD